MATTTNYGWTTPDDTALVKDGASAIRTLGSSIDSTLKTQIDAQIPDSIIDAKGDLIVGTADNTPARLAVGSNNQVLTADSTTASGVKWATVQSFDPTLAPVVSNGYVGTKTTGALADSTLIEDTTYYIPVFLKNLTYNQIICRGPQAAVTGTLTVRLGIYNADSTTLLPSTVLLDAGTVSITASGTDYAITISQTPSAGYYYLALNMQATTGTSAVRGWSTSSTGSAISSYWGTTLNSYVTGFSQTGVTGAFATAGTLTNNNVTPLIGLRMA